MKVAVLKGGSSLERTVSLRSGRPGRGRAGAARARGAARSTSAPTSSTACSAERPDVAFVALHGRGGEDGTVQELLELVGIPYTASRPGACIRCMDKVVAKHALRDAGIPTPDFYAFSQTAFEELGAARGAAGDRGAARLPDRGQARRAGLGARHQVRPHRRPTSRTRWWPPSPTTRRCCWSATSPGRDLAVSVLDSAGRPRGAAGRRGDPRRPRTSTTSRRATRSAARASSARPSCRRRSPLRAQELALATWQDARLRRVRPRRPDARRRRADGARGQRDPRPDGHVAAPAGRRGGRDRLRRRSWRACSTSPSRAPPPRLRRRRRRSPPASRGRGTP